MTEEDTKNAEIEEKNENLSEEDALKEEIRRFSAVVSDPSLRAHGMVYTSLAKLLERVSQVPAPFVKGLVKMSVTSSIRLYGQPKSFQHVARLLEVLSKRDYQSTLKSLLSTIQSSLPCVSNLSESKSQAQIPTMKWLLTVLSKGNPQDLEENASDICGTLGIISYWMAGSEKSWKIFQKKFSRIQKPLEPIIASKIAEKPDLSLITVVGSSSDVFRSVYVDQITKQFLLGKLRPPQFLVDRATKFVEFLEEKPDFSENLLPNIKKGLLRSPEVAIFGIQGIVEHLKFPLDSCAQDILKSTVSQIQNADSAIREAAIAIAVALTRKSGLPVIQKTLNTLFDQFSAAKAPEVKISIMEGIGRVAGVVELKEDVDKLADEVIGKTAKADKEAHDGIIESQWNAAVEWSVRLSKPTAALTTAFKEASKLQPAVKYIGYRALADILERRSKTSLPDGIDVKPLLQELETGPKGELSSIGLALLILRTTKKGSIEHTKAWSRASHAEALLKEKPLSLTKWQEAVAWAKLVETVILDRPCVDKSAAPSYSTPALKSLSLLLFWPHWKVRQQASRSLLAILEVEKALFAEALADLIFSDTATGGIDQLLRRVPGCPTQDTWQVPGEWYVPTLKLLLTPKEPELDKLAIHTLLLASIQRLVEVDGSVWLRWVHEHRESKTWQASEVFRETAIGRVLQCSDRGVRNTALITLVALHDERLRTDLWKHVESNLKQLEVKDYGRVTETEMSIYKCPEGQLYNTRVLDFDEAAGIKGQKGASIQDQLAEIQLIRELAEKRRKEGKLSAKQKQVMDKELAAEKETRDVLKTLFETAEAKLDEARAMVMADSAGAFARSELLFDYCMPLTRSLLVAEQAARLFLAYRDACFEHSDDYLGIFLLNMSFFTKKDGLFLVFEG
uniref:TOG domain-containing protein n=1 Tax=Caenorhabditis tropicalis TaxID=1561998 RepID=A0A1I7UWW7_9PELO